MFKEGKEGIACTDTTQRRAVMFSYPQEKSAERTLLARCLFIMVLLRPVLKI